VEGLVEGVKWFNPGSLQAREHESVLEKKFERRGKETPFHHTETIRRVVTTV
jgi:hypothetical protein